MDRREPEVIFFPFRDDFTWEGVQTKSYKSPDNSWLGVLRNEIIKTDEIHYRYFEIQKGGYSTLEKHEHPHIVMALRGRGTVVAGAEIYEMAPFDVIHIPPWKPHQLLANRGDVFGFICVVPAKRDRPRKLTRQEVEELIKENPRLKDILRYNPA